MASTGAFPTPLVMRLLAASVSVSYKAGNIIRDILKTGELGIIEKGRNDLQTEADRAAQRCIVATLHKHFPKVAIFGEESLDPAIRIPEDYIVKDFDPEVLSHPCPTGYKDVTDDQVVVWVDPLDGTAEFTQGLLDHVTVLIGVAVNGEAKGGVIYQPYYNYQEGPDATLGRCIWGLVGLGAFGFQPQNPPVGKNLITTTRSHSDWMVTEAVNSCEPTDIIRVGGAGHKVVLLLEGKVHAYVFASKGCKKWDTCAPEAVLHAIGGHLTDLLGKPILYYANVQRTNSGGVLATLHNHQWYVDKIPAEIKVNFISDVPSDGMIDKKKQLVEQIVCYHCGGDAGSSVDPPEFNQVDYSDASADVSELSKK
ncbi:3(2) 5-bisphosphate nucleotidase 1 [Biomphalaria pfeifferi]|uniref:3'(2'),5'-bisphosphate nucleotidase 1 n=1 Tax=Biomphalaria pfeifferi TaxID=112525 RepID=A0AAD8F1B8_BIOPF|nr:3(2) 5-bisphosphate nucleotidase 1 [Biomphalaria pfeifferi]